MLARAGSRLDRRPAQAGGRAGRQAGRRLSARSCPSCGAGGMRMRLCSAWTSGWHSGRGYHPSTGRTCRWAGTAHSQAAGRGHAHGLQVGRHCARAAWGSLAPAHLVALSAAKRGAGLQGLPILVTAACPTPGGTLLVHAGAAVWRGAVLQAPHGHTQGQRCGPTGGDCPGVPQRCAGQQQQEGGRTRGPLQPGCCPSRESRALAACLASPSTGNTPAAAGLQQGR